MNLEDRVERLNSMISKGRIIRKSWVSADDQGREVACLLAALSPEAGEAENPEACPAEVMPAWFAHITPWLDDNGSYSEWRRVVRRYAACANRWHTLDDSAWRRVEIVARRASVVEAMSHTTDEQVLAACRGVLAWLDSDMPESSQVAVKAAAGTAWAASAAEDAASAVAAAAARAAGAVAAAVSAAAAWTARAAASARRHNSASAEASDRITDKILSALEQECGL